jgi:hypothetical protein
MVNSILYIHIYIEPHIYAHCLIFMLIKSKGLIKIIYFHKSMSACI